jgi:signal transduction histidine kinase
LKINNLRIANPANPRSRAGIPADQLEKIFDPFFTTKPTGHGTGLGLTVSKTIMDVHGGVLTVSNQEQGGACATIMLKAESGR